jgi:hypothetical protein
VKSYCELDGKLSLSVFSEVALEVESTAFSLELNALSEPLYTRSCVYKK